jgi:hypothetical protein
MDRMKSDKKVLTLEECCHPFKTTFIVGNCDRGVFVGVGDNDYFYPLNQEVEVAEEAWGILRDVNKVRGFYVPVSYDPFKI